MKITLAQLREPIPATCGACGGDALILPDPAPKGTFHCPSCYAKRIREWNAEITESEARVLDGNR